VLPRWHGHRPNMAIGQRLIDAGADLNVADRYGCAAG
jgi:hypothetical protein